MWWTMWQLKSTDVDKRERAAIRLGKWQYSRAVKPLITALKDKAWQVRLAAAEALGKMPDAQAVEPLIALLKDDDRVKYGAAQVRYAAAQALGRIRDPRAVDPLIDSFKNGDKKMSDTAAEALGQIANPSAIEVLLDALKKGPLPGATEGLLGRIKDIRVSEALIAAGSVRAIRNALAAEQLIVLATTQPWSDTAVSSLERILEIDAAEVGVESLRKLAVLNAAPKIRTEYLEICPGFGIPRGYEVVSHREVSRKVWEKVDCHRINQMARQELMRRGLEA